MAIYSEWIFDPTHDIASYDDIYILQKILEIKITEQLFNVASFQKY
jgi:hypothetical protein